MRRARLDANNMDVQTSHQAARRGTWLPAATNPECNVDSVSEEGPRYSTTDLPQTGGWTPTSPCGACASPSAA
eukprot:1492858-Pyramimonas_sp.AAC.1